VPPSISGHSLFFTKVGWLLFLPSTICFLRRILYWRFLNFQNVPYAAISYFSCQGKEWDRQKINNISREVIKTYKQYCQIGFTFYFVGKHWNLVRPWMKRKEWKSVL
jgi:hypothetical protein